MDLLIVFLIGLMTSLVGSFVTGSIGMLTLPLLMSIGLSPLMALGVHRLGLTGFQIGSFYKLFKNGKVTWSLVAPLTIIGIPAAFIGTLIVLSFDEDLIRRLIGFVILIFIPISILKPQLGVVSEVTSKLKQKFGYVVYFFSSVYGSSIVVGTGILNTYIQAYFFGQTILESKATVKIPGIIKNIIVLTIFALQSYMDWGLGFSLLGGMLIGSYIGTHFAVKAGDGWMRIILLVTIALFSIKLILGL